jgi:lipopolysaccharide transport system ATP-binding protein
MCSDVVARARGLGKSYPIYRRPWHRLMQQLSPRGGHRWHDEFPALRGVDFELRRGETVGIVGRNGSGKSTLLQLICGTLAPSAGSVEVTGRVAALLELGSGFNPEFSGRENMYLNGTVLGLTRSEIDARFEAIAAFADIGEFIDRPVKTYSSGMQVRLAFAVAISVDPEILIVDEALSVGDEAFQRKCFARLQRVRDAGVSILFVSHSAGTVLEICDRALLLDRGELLGEGTPKHIIAQYHRLLFSPPEREEEVREAIRAGIATPLATVAAVGTAAGQDDGMFDPALVPVSGVAYPARGAEILDPRIETLDGGRVNLLRAGREYVYRYRVRFDVHASGVRCGMMIKNTTGVELAGAVTAQPAGAIAIVGAGQEIETSFTFRCLLAPGTYFLNAGVLGRAGESEEYLDRRIDVMMFRVLPDPARLATGHVDLDVKARIGPDARVAPA